MQSGIYRIRNTINGKVYIGSTKNFTKRWKQHVRMLSKNAHCNIILQRSYNIHGADSFVYEIIELVPYENPKITEREDYYISLYDSKKTGYNIADATFGDVLTNHPDRKLIIEKIRAGSLQRYSSMPNEEKERLRRTHIGHRNGMFGKKHDESAKEKMSTTRKEYKIIHGFGQTHGIRKSLIHKEKLSEKAKLRIGDKNPFFGKTHSEETKNMIRSKTIGKKPSNRKKLLADGIEYESAADCARANNISAGLVTYRIKSQKYNYEYIV